MQQPAPELAGAPRGRHPLQRRRLDHRAFQAPLAQQFADRRAHEHLERDQRADRVAGQAEYGRPARPQVAEALGLARLHRHLGELDTADFAQRLLNHVVRAHAHPAARHQHVGPQQLGFQDVHQSFVVIGDDADAVGGGAGVPGSGGQQVAVGVGDLSEAGFLADVDELAAGGDHQHPRAGPDQHPLPAERGQQGDLLWADG
jgi:hypothetical protein